MAATAMMMYWLCSCNMNSQSIDNISVTVIPSSSNGTFLAISGKGFSSIPSENMVSIGRTDAKVVSATPARLIVSVPAHVHGKVPVTVTVKEQSSNIVFLEYTPAALADALRP